MPQKPKEEKEAKPNEEATEPQPQAQPQPSPVPQELNREQLENLRRKLQKKFH
jgi:hypothetical protein